MVNTVIEEFDSISQLIKELSKRENNEVMKNRTSSEDRDEDFAGTKSYEEAVKFALEGYTKPLDALKRGTIEAERKGTAPRRCKVVNDIVGYTPNVPAAVIGLPQSMIRSDNEPKKSKVVEILYSPDANCMVSEKTIEKAGIAVLSLINNLEKSGYRVALKIGFFVADCDSKERAIATVKVKDWRQPIDLKKIAFPICNASMLRRIGFKWLETCEGLTYQSWRRGYGQSPEYKKAKQILNENKMISDKQFFINIDFCENNDFDVDKIATACGIKVR